MPLSAKSLVERITHKIKEIDAVAEDIPGVITIHNIRTTMLEYMSPGGLQQLNTSMEELHRMGEAYHSKYFNTDEAKEYVPKILGLLDRNNDNEILTFFQQVKIVIENQWKWHCSSIKILLRDDEEKPLLTLAISLPIEHGDNLSIKTDRLLKENNFLRKHYHLFHKLTKREKIALMHLALGKTAGEVAMEMNIATLTADTYRKSIKEKLSIRTTYEMAEYARAFDLI